MAQQQQINQRKQELVLRLKASRQSITRGQQELKTKLSPKRFLHRIFTEKPKAVFAGSSLAGLGAALLLRRRKKSKKQPRPSQPLHLVLISWLLSLVKPVVKAWLLARAKEALVTRAETATTRPAPPARPL
ncbi:hypothetical protein HW115_14035 [Verrucomicrobiaceae bacterium N1E253]|uniref:Uncharacterized protein n=1 Tax=Oceaniferula marina TaxID=2748318 RepID=A0A851GHR5_9BACT|nr:hypothetical protein [Oceaniferula marina]NWK56739.1 hypothetical protein [Oceaniferula marina]